MNIEDADLQALNAEGREVWDRKAAFWDALHGDEGNSFHRTLVSPTVEGLLQLRPGEHVLDLACGSGVLARRLAALGAVVTAVDFSAALLARARQRAESTGLEIDFRVADVTDETALRALGEGQFDAVTSTMALMDIAEIAPLFRATRYLLKPGGRVVIATAHPAFFSNDPVLVAERTEEDGELLERLYMKVERYQRGYARKGLGARDDPALHTYYHRSLSALLRPAFDAGLALDGLEEAAFAEADRNPERLLSQHNYTEFPLVIGFRLRRA